MRIRLVDLNDELEAAAWIPAQALSKPNWAHGSGVVTRVVLPAEDRAWPGPPRWPSWYAGVWASGELRLPPGARMVTGAGWRNKPPREA